MDAKALEAEISPTQVNRYLELLRKGDTEAFNDLIVLLHEDLQRIAHRQFGRERMNHTLQTDDLVNKLYLKLLASPKAEWKDHAHFLNSAARAMRQILIDHARVWKRRADGKGRVDLLTQDQNMEDLRGGAFLDNLLTLDQVIHKLETIDPNMAKIANLKLVLGLTLAEIARELALDLSRVKREWVIIKKYLGQTFEES